MNLLHSLNESQRSAVTAAEGHLLVVAGPGTGKTMTIAHRIAYLVDQGINPENILCLTFTNRAAREMKERTEALLASHSSNLFIGTFHSLGMRIMSNVYPNGFSIYNRDDQIELLKVVLKGHGINEKKGLNYSSIAERISRIKNLIEEPDERIGNIYERYRAALQENSALDLDDLVLRPVELLDNGEMLERYQGMFRHIIVDEYQDINPLQYRLLRLLVGKKGSICAVGDPDQAIYAFRGADVGNFLNFERDFSNSRRVVLSENYRSTAMVLNASDAVIRNNLKRIPKEVVPLREKGDPVVIISVPDERAEGETIVKEIEKRIGGTSHYNLMQMKERVDDRPYSFSDFAVIFRTNAQAKVIEEAFVASGIPYQVVGREAPSEKREIEDTISYLRVLINPQDDRAIRKILTIPFKDGIERMDLSGLFTYAEREGLSLYEAIRIQADEGDRNLREFFAMIERLIALRDRLPVDEFLKALLEETGLREYYRDGGEGLAFMEDLATAYRDMASPEALIRFTNELSLSNPADGFDPRAEAVTLMTLHMAKGLEFRVVFITGVEEGLIPYTLKKGDVDIEEERRLFYVGMTRAMNELFLIHARKRLMYGERTARSPSPFLREIPEEFAEKRFIREKVKRQKKDQQIGLF